jgi:hypothetical protein
MLEGFSTALRSAQPARDHELRFVNVDCSGAFVQSGSKSNTMSLSERCSVAAIALALLFHAGCARQPPAARRALQLWVVGDDALTLRLRDALEAAVQQSRTFRMSVDEPPAVVIRIPANVKWQDQGGRRKVLYTAQFSAPSSHESAAVKGSCWGDAAERCAADILRSAEKFMARAEHR